MKNKLRIYISVCILSLTIGQAFAASFQNACISPVTTKAFLDDMDSFIAEVEAQYDNSPVAKMKECGVSKEKILGFDVYKDPFAEKSAIQRAKDAEPQPDVMSTAFMSNWDEVKRIMDMNTDVNAGVNNFLASTFAGNTTMFDMDNEEIMQRFEKLRELAYRSSLTCSQRTIDNIPILFVDVDFIPNSKDANGKPIPKYETALPLYQSVLGRYLAYSKLYAYFLNSKKSVLDRNEVKQTPVGINELLGVEAVYTRTLNQTYGKLMGKLYETTDASKYPNRTTLVGRISNKEFLFNLNICLHADADCTEPESIVANDVKMLINPFTASSYSDLIPSSTVQDGKVSACFPAGYKIEQLTQSWDSLLTSGSEFGEVMASFGTAWTDIEKSIDTAKDSLTASWDAMKASVKGGMENISKAFKNLQEQLSKVQELISIKVAARKTGGLPGESSTNIRQSGGNSCTLKSEQFHTFIPTEIYAQIYQISAKEQNEARCHEQELYSSIQKMYSSSDQSLISFVFTGYWKKMLNSFSGKLPSDTVVGAVGINSLADAAYKRLNSVCHKHQYVQGADCADIPEKH